MSSAGLVSSTGLAALRLETFISGAAGSFLTGEPPALARLLK